MRQDLAWFRRHNDARAVSNQAVVGASVRACIARER